MKDKLNRKSTSVSTQATEDDIMQESEVKTTADSGKIAEL
jgi:hypothetical protein